MERIGSSARGILCFLGGDGGCSVQYHLEGPRPLALGDIDPRPATCSVLPALGLAPGDRTLVCSEPHAVPEAPHLPELHLSCRHWGQIWSHKCREAHRVSEPCGGSQSHSGGPHIRAYREKPGDTALGTVTGPFSAVLLSAFVTLCCGLPASRQLVSVRSSCDAKGALPAGPRPARTSDQGLEKAPCDCRGLPASRASSSD